MQHFQMCASKRVFNKYSLPFLNVDLATLAAAIECLFNMFCQIFSDFTTIIKIVCNDYSSVMAIILWNAWR